MAEIFLAIVFALAGLPLAGISLIALLWMTEDETGQVAAVFGLLALGCFGLSALFIWGA